MTDLDIWKKVVSDMRSVSPSCINIFDEMLAELNKGDEELIETPPYISIVKLGRNIFLPLKQYREYYEMLEENGEKF
jgi:hypothetical protein